MLQLYIANPEVREDLAAGPMDRIFPRWRSNFPNSVIRAVRPDD